MAVGKLSSSLFFPKTRISRSRSSGRYLHLLEKRNGGNLYVFLCESQPVTSLTSWGVPKRCPLCSQNYPISTENQA